jgi:hypothetical protein
LSSGGAVVARNPRRTKLVEKSAIPALTCNELLDAALLKLVSIE